VLSSGGEDVRTALSAGSLQLAVCEHLYRLQGHQPRIASRNDLYLAVAYAVPASLWPVLLVSRSTFLDAIFPV
jgi:starch phosphorylase